ncbi:MAG: hypothetical protein IJY47_04510 [Clostridia bacterium]|nr:hypothetical protein [Clostridia bacterium]
MKERRTKSRDKSFLVAVSVCVLLCLAVLGAVLLADPIAGWQAKRRAADILSDGGECRVVLTDPTQSGQVLFSDAQVILSEEDAAPLRDTLYEVLCESQYESREAATAGTWLPSVTVYTREEQVTVFVSEETLCLERDGKRIVFSIAEEQASDYRALYEEITARLKEVSR